MLRRPKKLKRTTRWKKLKKLRKKVRPILWMNGLQKVKLAILMNLISNNFFFDNFD